MEMASSSSSSSSHSSYSHVHGLKFGKKIYFEDVSVGVQAKSSVGSMAGGGLPPPSPSCRKGKSGVVQGGGGGGGQTPRCQVEGCKVDLSDAKTYYSRHKVCDMHSKSPKVIVAGLEQRFCQQCSRFHLLPEFDQGKRSCRRRLAGHNERRRKPPARSLLSSRYGSLASSIFENNSQTGSFLMDFTAYPKVTGKETWPATRAADHVSGNPETCTGKVLPFPWQSNSENPPPDLFLQGSSTRTVYPCNDINIPPTGECFTGAGVSNSNCALSLLSNQPCGSRNQPSIIWGSNLLNANAINQCSSSSWGLKGNESSGNLHEMPPYLGLGQISHPANNQYSGELELFQQDRNDYMDVEHTRAYDYSVPNIHWSL